LQEIQPHVFYLALAILFAGGRSLGCPENLGAAGTYYDAVPRILGVSNHNMYMSTRLFEFVWAGKSDWSTTSDSIIIL
jgi:hypothetical protein